MFPLTIAKVDEILFQDDVFSVNCPGTDGELTVLSHHVPLITSLRKGVIRVRRAKDGKEQNFPVEQGLLEVGKEGTVILL